jgi:hypothetical protein
MAISESSSLAESAKLRPFLMTAGNPLLQRRKVNLKAKFEFGLSHFGGKSLVACAFNTMARAKPCASSYT